MTRGAGPGAGLAGASRRLVAGLPAVAVAAATLATGAACLVVPLIFVSGLEAPFLVPKTAVLELAAALAFLAFSLQRASVDQPLVARPVALGAALVLGTTAASWLVAERHGTGGSLRGGGAGALGGAAAVWPRGTAVLAGDPDRAPERRSTTVTGSAAVVSAIGLGQHLDLLHLSIPVISAPGSTFGNRNLAAEAVAMSLPLGLGALAEALRRAGRWRRAEPIALAVALALELVYLAATRARGAWLGGGRGRAGGDPADPPAAVAAGDRGGAWAWPRWQRWRRSSPGS